MLIQLTSKDNLLTYLESHYISFFGQALSCEVMLAIGTAHPHILHLTFKIYIKARKAWDLLTILNWAILLSTYLLHIWKYRCSDFLPTNSTNTPYKIHFRIFNTTSEEDLVRKDRLGIAHTEQYSESVSFKQLSNLE